MLIISTFIIKYFLPHNLIKLKEKCTYYDPIQILFRQLGEVLLNTIAFKITQFIPSRKDLDCRSRVP